MPIKIGDPVRQIVTPFAGTVTSIKYNETDGCLEHLVSSADGTQSVWFRVEQIEKDEAK